ncbi:MAG: phenylalanine--tRNA ligase subunit beta [Gammaproteobacteria bacterium]|jgi:phenylalanyl-tRNA synthetase beta chain
MKVSYQWLKEFVAVPDDAQAVADRLSLAGLEVAAVEPAAPALDDIVVGEVVEVERHPDADKLSVCRVNVGAGKESRIVCGAPNVRPGMRAAVVLPGSRLPDGTRIRKATLRGVESAGMLCSAKELGLGDDHSGLLELGTDARPGTPVGEYLGGEDRVIDIEITPNRGDCLGMLGVARDVSALYDLELAEPAADEVPAVQDVQVAVRLDAPVACPIFLGRVIHGVDPAAETPLWMCERLRRAGIRPVSPTVDVTQYVMLELGQPMHAYDLRQIRGGIVVRMAEEGEELQLLDGSMVKLDADMLVIADHERVLGLAGIMGGEGSGVQADTTDLYLECAWFAPEAINGRPRRLGLHTDAGYRFERGVDPQGQRRAMERATLLLQEIAGGRPGPVVESVDKSRLPVRNTISLRRQRLERILGMRVPDAEVERILTRLAMPPRPGQEGWTVQAPGHRFDIEIEEDLVEEVGRIYGYDHIQPAQYPTTQPMEPVPEGQLSLSRLRAPLVERGYQEVITYSFVPRELQEALTGNSGIELANPITAEMTHMRCMLWPGLVQALQYNLNRQQARVRIFETGLRFIEQRSEIKQETVISGLVFGPVHPEQWDLQQRETDFADVKGDLEALLAVGNREAEFDFEAAEHVALHPGQSARVLRDQVPFGWVGRLHPRLSARLDLPAGIYLFELALGPLQSASIPELETISRFPAIRRDLAVVVEEGVSAARIRDCVTKAAGNLLKELRIFDVYRGKGVDSGRKSIALGLILQDSSRTLTESAIDEVMGAVIGRLRDDVQGIIRD